MAFNKDDCHGFYLIYYNSTKENIKSKKELITILRESGRNVNNEVISKYWTKDTKEITFENYIKICQEMPIITKTDLVKALKMMDINKYGYLDKTEFVKAMSSIDSQLNDRDVMEIVKKVDVKDEGKLNIEAIAELILSNMDSFKKLGHSKILEKEGKLPPELDRNRKLISETGEKSLSINDDDDDIDTFNSRKSNKSAINEIHIDKITPGKFDYNEPKNLKSWPKTTLRGCLFLGDNSASNSVQDPNIECHIYRFTINTSSNVFLVMSPLTILQKLDLRQVPDLGFVILNKSEEIVALSMPADASGTVYFSGNLNAGSYTVLPFTTGSKLKAKSNDAKENFTNLKPLKKVADDEYAFTSEIMTMLEDIFKICDIDGNGYLNKDEFVWYSSKTSEDEWEEEMWTDLKKLVKLHNDEVSFSNFTELILQEVREEKYEPAPLFLTFDLFGFNEKCMIEEAFPFSLTFSVESSEFLAKCSGIVNKNSLIELSLTKYVINQGEKLTTKPEWKDCNLCMLCKNGRILIGVENTNPASKETPIRLSINMEKSKNLAVYKDKFQRQITINTGMQELVVHGVPIEPKVPISCDCFIRRT